MGLEVANYIPELDDSNPTGLDPRSQGDDHIRLTKAAIQGSFPNFVGSTATPKFVTKTEDQLNDCAERSADETVSGQWDLTNPDTMIDLIRARDLVDQTSGAFISGGWQFVSDTFIQDAQGGGIRKIGWRNPDRLALLDADVTAQQLWEGLCGDMTPSQLRTITLPALEQGTTFRIFNNGDNETIRFVPDAGQTLFFYPGTGQRQGSGNFLLQGGGVAEIYSPALSVWRIFGNGISAE